MISSGPAAAEAVKLRRRAWPLGGHEGVNLTPTLYSVEGETGRGVPPPTGGGGSSQLAGPHARKFWWENTFVTIL